MFEVVAFTELMQQVWTWKKRDPSGELEMVCSAADQMTYFC